MCVFGTVARKATVRERTQAVEKLSASEAETGRLHLELAAARTAAADKQASVIAEFFMWMSCLGSTVTDQFVLNQE